MPAETVQPVVVALVTDLLFAVRIQDAIRAAGARAEMVDNGAALWDAIDAFPALVLIDLSVDDDWAGVVRRAKNLPHTRPIPIVAFGNHVDTATLQAARAAGCDHAWARSRFVTELPALLQRTLYPPLREAPACQEPAPPELVHGIEQFNAGEYWECHETLEQLWMRETRPVRDLYQGILQIGVAFHHLRNGNYPGAIKMFRRGLPHLRGFPSICNGVPVAALAQAARAVHDEVVALGPERIDEYDLRCLPRIELAESAP